MHLNTLPGVSRMLCCSIHHALFPPLIPPAADHLAGNISPTAKMILLHIASYYHTELLYCYPSQERIAKEIGISRRTVNKYLALLEQHGYLHPKLRISGISNPALLSS